MPSSPAPADPVPADPTPGLPTRRTAIGIALLSVVAASCSAKADSGSGSARAKTAALPQPKITIAPVDGSGQARPEKGITVTVSGGRLLDVTVKGGSTTVTGSLDAAGTTWRSEWTLTPGTAYTVTANATTATAIVTESTTVATAQTAAPAAQTSAPSAAQDVTATATSRFTTLKASAHLAITDVTPTAGETVGVGMPIMVTFNRNVGDRAAVEKALQVHSAHGDEGAWHWISDQQVFYRTKDYWKAHQKITFTAHLAGVRAGQGVYGAKNLTKQFTVGRSQISTVNTKSHYMTVKQNGATVRSIPISAGMGTTREYTTTNGIHLTMAKTNPEHMISPGRSPGDPGYYDEIVNYAVRISNSGEFVHSAPWSVGSQGHANVSHGCVNASPTNAKWFYGQSLRGDVVKITGTDRQLEWNNGWGFWQMSWATWRKGSALS
jgi:lipoprotein-anchoring transpeptidase ErfK/SrfK